MRDIITQSDKRRNLNRVYIKSRKARKAFGQNVVKFMKSFMVDKRIAEALNGSCEKIEKLDVSKINDYWIVKELKTNDSFYVQHNETWTCTCGKLSSTGLPCSHLMKILIDNGTFYEISPKLISPRWNIEKEKMEISLIEKSDEYTIVN